VVSNTSMKELLSHLHVETFVLDIKEPIAELPHIEDITLRQRDANTLEADLDKSRSLNFLFEKLSEHNIRVSSMRNKTSRLEELFINLVEKDKIQDSESNDVEAAS